jgi:hypothetical protein
MPWHRSFEEPHFQAHNALATLMTPTSLDFDLEKFWPEARNSQLRDCCDSVGLFVSQAGLSIFAHSTRARLLSAERAANAKSSVDPVRKLLRTLLSCFCSCRTRRVASATPTETWTQASPLTDQVASSPAAWNPERRLVSTPTSADPPVKDPHAAGPRVAHMRATLAGVVIRDPFSVGSVHIVHLSFLLPALLDSPSMSLAPAKRNMPYGASRLSTLSHFSTHHMSSPARKIWAQGVTHHSWLHVLRESRLARMGSRRRRRHRAHQSGVRPRHQRLRHLKCTPFPSHRLLFVLISRFRFTRTACQRRSSVRRSSSTTCPGTRLS